MPRLALLLCAFAACAPAAGEESGRPSSMDMDIIPPHKGFVPIGDAMAGCTSVLYRESRPAITPKGFRLSPVQALAIAMHAGALDCDTRFYISLSADNSSYLIISLDTSQNTFPITSFLLNGKTGKLKKIVLKVKNFKLHDSASKVSKPGN